MASVNVKAALAAVANYRVRFVVDGDAEFEECNGERRPLTREEYKANGYREKDAKGRYRDVSYARYLEYQGNPERHVFLQCEVQKRCPCCGDWAYVTGTGGIDFMDDAPELAAVDQWFTEEEIEQIPGYLREVAREDLDEARNA